MKTEIATELNRVNQRTHARAPAIHLLLGATLALGLGDVAVTHADDDCDDSEVANSVVYFTSSYQGKLFGLNAATGAKLLELPIGISDSGPAVSRGQVYVGTGDAISAAFTGSAGPGSILALGL